MSSLVVSFSLSGDFLFVLACALVCMCVASSLWRLILANNALGEGVHF